MDVVEEVAEVPAEAPGVLRGGLGLHHLPLL